ncbi:MAG TPA: multicopper oxidase domain-containing protein [Flavobacteriales bacterium]|nr:multicopper oxidase domain-containing protein [Flavobacteriales bacterium]
MHYRYLLLLSLLPCSALAQNPLAIPPILDMDTFHLVVDEHVHQFYPGLNTNTYGASADYLGPTLLMHKGDTTCIRVQNELAEVTSMHWHGMQLPGIMDGGPPREVMPGEEWLAKFKVKNPAGTYWYHPHPHGLTAEQVNFGVAGMIIVKDDTEAQLELPRTYGVDDIPLVVQDRKFQPNGDFALYPLGDSVLVNGTPNAYVECPAQVVRLRLLNGANARVYRFGFDDDRSFSMIGTDGGLMDAPTSINRLLLSNGERAEILVDLSGMEGDSLTLMSYGAELNSWVPGSSYFLWESSALNGINFPIIRIRVVAPTANPITTIPATLVNSTPPLLGDVSRTRQKSLSGNGMVGMGMFYINGLQFNMDVVNDTVVRGATEIWSVLNASDIAHPFHIHGGSFYILDRDGVPPPAYERGAKDVVLVNMAETVRFIMRFEEVTDGWPFMYHCHNLMHEDNMMMLQYMVQEPLMSVAEVDGKEAAVIYPSPTSARATFRSTFPVNEVVLTDAVGRAVLRERVAPTALGEVDLSRLPAGVYTVGLFGDGSSSHTTVVRE